MPVRLILAESRHNRAANRLSISKANARPSRIFLPGTDKSDELKRRMRGYRETARKATTAFRPPKAKEFESAAPTCWARDWLGM